MSDGRAALLRIHAAVSAGDVDALRAAFGNTPDFPNSRDECGETCLEHAILRGSPAFVSVLLDLGADPNYGDHAGFPSLIAAIDRAASDRLEVLEILLDAGALIEQRGTNDYTPLHYAACRDDAEAVTLLLQRGADPEARTRIDNYGTPLEEAEHFGHRVGAEALRRHTAPRRSDADRA